MESKTVDVQKTKLQDLISWVTAGAEIILTQGGKPIARMEPMTSFAPQRIAGLHPGTIWTSSDFDFPLPDDYWTGDSAKAA